MTVAPSLLHDTPFRLFCCLSGPIPEHRSGRTSALARSFLTYLLSCAIPLDPHVINACCITRVQADHHTLPILAAAHSISCSLPVTRLATRKPQGLKAYAWCSPHPHASLMARASTIHENTSCLHPAVCRFLRPFSIFSTVPHSPTIAHIPYGARPRIKLPVDPSRSSVSAPVVLEKVLGVNFQRMSFVSNSPHICVVLLKTSSPAPSPPLRLPLCSSPSFSPERPSALSLPRIPHTTLGSIVVYVCNLSLSSWPARTYAYARGTRSVLMDPVRALQQYYVPTTRQTARFRESMLLSSGPYVKYEDHLNLV
ncbi:hypothetical protein BC826DRAFT_611942 [Russula brevipes]|nr:hypothetical protein BC826DRAFT_611942 [Russula brevipes]